MSAKAAESAQATDKPKGKSKKGLVIAVVAGMVVASGGAGGAWYFLNKKGHGDTTAKEEPAHEEEASKHAAAPVYLALENMVLNLADPGGERVAQIGITLELESEKTVEKIKGVMPKVRSGVLMLVSQRTSNELLKRDGKEKLAIDIRAEVSDVLGYEVESSRPSQSKSDGTDDVEPPPRKKKRTAYSPVQGVLFSAFIVQ